MDEYGFDGQPGGDWPAFTNASSMGVNFGNSSEVGVVDYSVCTFWDPINEAVFKLVANATANGTATSPSGSPSATSSRSGPATSTKASMARRFG